jgi:hypothetical protein
MKKNMGKVDRTIRLIIVVLFAFLYFEGYVTGILGLILLILGGVFVLTSVIGFCPLYKILKVNTRPTKE